MGKVININDIKTNNNDELVTNADIDVNLNAYIIYRKQITDYINYIAKKNIKEKENTDEQFKFLQQFYNSYFSVTEQVAEQMLDGNMTNKDEFIYLVKNLDNISQKILPLKHMEYLSSLDRESLERIRNRNKFETTSLDYTIDDYIDYRDYIDGYINDLTELSSNKTREFAKTEQLYIITLLYVAFENISEEIKNEVVNGNYKNIEVLSMMIREYEKIVEEIPNAVASKTIKKLSYKKDNK